jgi:prolyl-tRNA editing enzyme YbaK/EbsC (Cys-tRNA(Pro) deacylase)
MAAEPRGGSAERVRAALAALGLPCEVKEFPADTRTSDQAAAAVGCEVAQIAKSLVFRAMTSDRPVLVIASGANRVDETALAAAVGEPIGKADAAFVRARTGFAIGGVAPVGHLEPPLTYVDRSLLGHGEIWAAAGRPNAVFRTTPDALLAMTGGTVIDVA